LSWLRSFRNRLWREFPEFFTIGLRDFGAVVLAENVFRIAHFNRDRTVRFFERNPV